MAEKRKSLRQRLAQLLEAELLSEFGIVVCVDPERLYPAQGWYRTAPASDCVRWTGFGLWKVGGAEAFGRALVVSFDCWETMTACVKAGVTLNRESATAFSVSAATTEERR